MKYTVVEERDIKDFLEKVNKLLQQGWICQGGICFSWPEGSRKHWCQAMIHK
ncbi:DUF1737 domain-containing protein [Patescibacteria group bacterium]|nr:DUF1737 domain-containing protein [Patescibacteria group bacterium]